MPVRPMHYPLMEFLGLVIAWTGLIYLASRIPGAIPSAWWQCVLAILVGWFLSDVVTGLAHWTMDTWGSERTPIIGRMFILDFRVHHTDQLAMTRHGFLETNGNNSIAALLVIVPLVIWPPVTQAWLLFAVSFMFGVLVTNQIHKWAHLPTPPAIIKWFQWMGLILPKQKHAIHHAGEHTFAYGITNGWSMRLLDSIGFFRGLEFVITGITGVKPRAS